VKSETAAGAPSRPSSISTEHAAEGAASGRGPRSALLEWLNRQKPAATVAMWFGAFLFTWRLHELVDRVLWFPPTWRTMSAFLLVAIGGLAFTVVRKMNEVRDDELAEKKTDRHARHREARRRVRWASALAVAFFAFTCSYTLLWHRCVVHYVRDAKTSVAAAAKKPPESPPAVASSRASSRDDERTFRDGVAREQADAASKSEQDPWPAHEYFYVPLFVYGRVGDYDPTEGNLLECLNNDPYGLEEAFATRCGAQFGATNTIFLVVYGLMIGSFAGAVAFTFSPVEALGEAAGERLRSA